MFDKLSIVKIIIIIIKLNYRDLGHKKPWNNQIWISNIIGYIWITRSGVAILTNNSTKKKRNPYKVSGGIFCLLCNWRGVRKKGRKRGRGLWGNFPLERFVRISFPCPCTRYSLLVNILQKLKLTDCCQETSTNNKINKAAILIFKI